MRRVGRAARGVAVGAALFVGMTAAASRWLQPLRRYEVEGESMSPSLEAGDYVLAVRLPRWAGRSVFGWRVGWIVVAERPDRPGLTIIKRVASVEGASREEEGERVTITLLGDNPAASTDSRQFGPVGAEAVWGVVVVRYWPAGRVGGLL